MKLLIPFLTVALATSAMAEVLTVTTTMALIYYITTPGRAPTTTVVSSSVIFSLYTVPPSSTSSLPKSSSASKLSSTKLVTSVKSSAIFATTSAPVFKSSTKPSLPPSSSKPAPSSSKPASSTKPTTAPSSSKPLSSTVPPPPPPPSSSKPASSSTKASSSSIKPSTSSVGDGLPLPTDYISTGLFYHNKHRLNHSAPIASWNPTQATNAALIAASCVFSHNMGVGGGGYGQNLAAYGSSNLGGMTPSQMLAKAITTQWYYNEVNLYLNSYYAPGTPDMTKFSGFGHFTQVVWKGSTTVGCATQLCPAGTIFGIDSYFTVCNYVPQGNFVGAFGTNVLPPIGLPAIPMP